MGDCLAEFAFRDDRISRSAGSFFLWREVSRGGCSALAGDVVVADGCGALSVGCVHDAEVVALRVQHPGVAVEPFLDGRSEGDESFDFRVLVRRVDVEVDGRL